MSPAGERLRDGLPDRLGRRSDGWEVTRRGDDVRIARESTGSYPLELTGVLASGPQDPIAAGQQVSDLAEALRAHRPPCVLPALPAFLALLAEGKWTQSPSEAWTAAARVAEAGREALTTAAQASDADAARILPLVRRARFLLLAEPANKRVFGSPETLTARTRQARDEWALDLLNRDEHPLLLAWDDARIDTELRHLVRNVNPADATTAGFVSWIVREAFLPRFMLLDAWRLLGPRVGRLGSWLVGAPLALAGLAPLAGLAWVAGGLTHGGIWLVRVVGGLAALAYAALVAVSVTRREAALLWCLRFSAGAVIGQVALVSLDDGWADLPGRWWLLAGGGLIAAALGYLIIEARANGVPAGRFALGRAVAVLGLGFAHAVAVAALVLALVVPAIKPGLSEKIGHLAGGGVAAVLVLAAAAGLAAGVFLQVLWDDRPVTYPLKHLPWRGRVR